jgi:hypothetical protein
LTINSTPDDRRLATHAANRWAQLDKNTRFDGPSVRFVRDPVSPASEAKALFRFFSNPTF